MDLISREKMIGIIDNMRGYMDDDGYIMVYKGDVIANIESIPSAENIGRWIVEDDKVICSECYESNLETDYCPHCGAKMI